MLLLREQAVSTAYPWGYIVGQRRRFFFFPLANGSRGASSVKQRRAGSVAVSVMRRASDLRWEFWWRFLCVPAADAVQRRRAGRKRRLAGGKWGGAPKALARDIRLRCTEPGPSPVDTYARRRPYRVSATHRARRETWRPLSPSGPAGCCSRMSRMPCFGLLLLINGLR